MTLRQFIKDKLNSTDEPIKQVARSAGVPYGAVHYFKTKGKDMESRHLEKLYFHFTKRPLINEG